MRSPVHESSELSGKPSTGRTQALIELSDYQRARLSYGSYVLAGPKLIFVETPKCACTSMKHSIAALGGFDFRDTKDTIAPAKTIELGIHDRKLVDIATLSSKSPEEIASLVTDPDYFRFCMVRNPYARLASAWVDRLLCQSLSPLAPILSNLPFPEYVADWRYLRAKFNEFVDYLYRHEAPHFSNHHWQPMRDLVMPDLMNYSMVMRVERLHEMLPVLVAHVEKSGNTWPGLPRVNETPIRISTEIYTKSSVRKVAEMFEGDFAEFGYSTELELRSSTSGSLPDAGFVQSIQKRNQRIFHLSLKLRGMI